MLKELIENPAQVDSILEHPRAWSEQWIDAAKKIKGIPELKPKPTGEIAEKILGGSMAFELRRKTRDTNLLRRIIEKFIPGLKTKRLETLVGREIMEKVPEDINPIVALLYKFAPRRVQFAKDPIASEIVMRSIQSQINLEAERTALNDKVTEIEKKFNGKEDEYSQLVDYIEMGFTDEELGRLPAKYGEAMRKLRELERAKLDLIINELKIDTSNWRFTPENYLHHMWRGQWEVYSPSKNKRLFIGNLKETQNFFEKNWIYNPKTDAVIRPRVIETGFTTVQLSQKGFWRFVSRVAKAMEVSTENVLDDVAFKGIASIKRKRVFVGAFKPRLANLGGYVKDPFLVERIVWNKILRKKHIEPVSQWARYRINDLPPQIKTNMEKYLTMVEKVGFTEPSFWAWQKIIGTFTKTQANLKLGYRPTSALINRFQDVSFTLPDVGFKIWGRGKMFAYSPEGKELIKKSNVIHAPIKYEMGEWKPSRRVAWWKPLKMFDVTERVVRSEALMERFLEAFERFDYKEVNKNFEKYGIKKDYKNQEDMALDYAIRAIASDMGFYNYTDFPEFMSWHPIMRVPSQFKFVPILWFDKAVRITDGKPPSGTEIFYETNPYTSGEKGARFFRFWTINLLFAGIRLFDLLLRWVLPVALASALLKQPKWMNGIFALFGLDVSRSFSPDPFELININKKWWEMLLGPYSSDIKIIIKALQDKNPKLLLNIFPQLQRVASALMASDNVVTNFYTDVPQAKLSTFELTMLGLGFTPLTLTEARNLSVVISTLDKEYKTTKKSVENAWEAEDKEKAKSIRDDWNAKMEEWYSLIAERTEEILKRELTNKEKGKIKNRYNISKDDWKRWRDNWKKGVKEEPFGVEKQLRLK